MTRYSQKCFLKFNRDITRTGLHYVLKTQRDKISQFFKYPSFLMGSHLDRGEHLIYPHGEFVLFDQPLEAKIKIFFYMYYLTEV